MPGFAGDCGTMQPVEGSSAFGFTTKLSLEMTSLAKYL